MACKVFLPSAFGIFEQTVIWPVRAGRVSWCLAPTMKAVMLALVLGFIYACILLAAIFNHCCSKNVFKQGLKRIQSL